MKHRHFPHYIDDADFTTNAPSYYEDLARKEKLIRLLAERIWGYEKILDETLEEIQERFRAWDKNLEDFPDDVKALLQKWLDDGTLDHIINDTIFNWKLDTSIFEQFRDSITAQLQQKADETEVNKELSRKANHSEVRLKENKIEPEDASDRLLELVTGQAEVNLLSIPQNESVDFTKLENNVYDAMVLNKFRVSDIEIGSFDSNGDFIHSPSQSRVGTPNMFKVKEKSVIGLKNYETYKMNVVFYRIGDGAFINPTGWFEKDVTVDEDCFVRIFIAYKDDRVITTNELPTIREMIKPIEFNLRDKSVNLTTLTDELLNLVLSSDKQYKISYLTKWEHGSLNNDGSTGSGNTSRLRTQDFIEVSKGSVLSVDGYKMYPYVFSKTYEYVTHEFWTTDDYEIPQDGYIKMLVAKNDDSVISDSEIQVLGDSVSIRTSSTSHNNDDTVLKKYRFVDELTGYYEINDVQTVEDAFNSQHTEVYGLYDGLVNQFSDVFTSLQLGQEPTGLPINAYSFKPISINSSKPIKRPKIVITTGIHGNEKSPVYSTYNLFYHMLNNWQSHPILEFLRFNVEFEVVPIVNPHGFNNNSRFNSNSVDLNRNFPHEWSTNHDYVGDSPASEIETQLILTFMENHQDAEYWIDYHNMTFRDGFISYVLSDEASCNEVVGRSIQKVGRKLQQKFELFPQDDNHKWGYTTNGVTGSLINQTDIYPVKGLILEAIDKVEWAGTSQEDTPLTVEVGVHLLVNSLKGLIKQLY